MEAPQTQSSQAYATRAALPGADPESGMAPASPEPTAFWLVAGTAWRWRRFIAGVTALGAVATLVIVLMMPNEYRAEAHVMTPEQPGSSLLGALGRNLSSAARLLGDDRSGDYSRYFTILMSRSMAEAVVDSFKLVRVYDLADAKHPHEEAIRELESRSEFELDEEYEFLRVSVLDRSPVRAAQMANFYVRQLNVQNQRLTTESAAVYRSFIETRYRQANRDIDSLLQRAKEFQQRYGIFDLPAQTTAFYEQVGTLRSEVARLRVQYEAALAQGGPENPDVQSLARAVAAAERQYNAALAGGEQTFPVSRRAAPEVAREYAEIERERLLQTSIMEVLAPLYESARLEESKVSPAVQVVDHAVPPVRKAAPRRSLILLSVTAAAFLLALLLAVSVETWRRFAPVVRRRLAQA
jgi:tyrosine-protein kinase Etk/Wzc